MKNYEVLLTRARREAILRMQKEAKKFGAQKIINIRFETSSVSGAFVELSIEVNSANISYVTIAGNSAQDSVHLDYLQFNKIDENSGLDPNFDSSTGIVSLPRITIDGKDVFVNVELLLKSDGTYSLLKADPE